MSPRLRVCSSSATSLPRVSTSAEPLGARGQAPKSRWPRPATPSERRTSGNVGRLSLPTMARALLCREPFPAPSDQCGPRRAGSVPLLSSLVLLGQGLPTTRPGVAYPSCLAQGTRRRGEVQTPQSASCSQPLLEAFSTDTPRAETWVLGVRLCLHERSVGAALNGSSTHLYIFLRLPAIPIVQAIVFCHPGDTRGLGAGLSVSVCPLLTVPATLGSLMGAALSLPLTGS